MRLPGLLLSAVLLCSSATLQAPCSSAAEPPRPHNILLMIGDDHGRDLGCYGNTAIKTPNLDRLASAGVRFEYAFATVASCSPSRSVIMSGLYNHTSGQYGLAHADHNFHSLSKTQGVSKILAARGYRTGIIGKYHLLPESSYPHQYVASNGVGGSRNVLHMAQQARDFFATSADRPFYLLIGFSDPHRSGRGAQFANRPDYPGIKPLLYSPSDVLLPYFLPDQPDARHDLAEYYQSVSRLDQGVGLILDALRETGKDSSTLVIYLTDNGIPFPGAKTNLYDPGVHLPLLVRSPEQKSKGLVNRAMASWIDIAPTLLDWAAAKAPYALPGRSLLPILDQDNPAGWDQVFLSHTFHEVTMYYPVRGIRTRRYKFLANLFPELEFRHASDLYYSDTWQGILRRHDTMMGERSVQSYLHRPAEELYDLQSDPHELTNLASDPRHKDVLTDLRARTRKMQRDTADPWRVKYEY